MNKKFEQSTIETQTSEEYEFHKVAIMAGVEEARAEYTCELRSTRRYTRVRRGAVRANSTFPAIAGQPQ